MICLCPIISVVIMEQLKSESDLLLCKQLYAVTENQNICVFKKKHLNHPLWLIIQMIFLSRSPFFNIYIIQWPSLKWFMVPWAYVILVWILAIPLSYGPLWWSKNENCMRMKTSTSAEGWKANLWTLGLLSMGH